MSKIFASFCLVTRQLALILVFLQSILLLVYLLVKSHVLRDTVLLTTSRTTDHHRDRLDFGLIFTITNLQESFVKPDGCQRLLCFCFGLVSLLIVQQRVSPRLFRHLFFLASAFLPLPLLLCYDCVPKSEIGCHPTT